MATTEFYFSAGSGAAKSDGKTAVFDTKPNINGVQYDSIVLDDTQKRAQKTLNGQVLDLTPEEQTAVRNYAAQATTAVPADNSVVKTTPQTFTDAQKDQAQSNLGLPAKLGEKYSKTGGTISGEVRLSQKQALIGRPDASGLMGLYGGSRHKDGASLSLHGGDAPSNKGGWVLNACSTDGTESSSLGGFPNGSLKFNGKYVEVVESSGQGYIRYKSGFQVCWGRVPINTPTDFVSAGPLFRAILPTVTFAVPFKDSSAIVSSSRQELYTAAESFFKADEVTGGGFIPHVIKTTPDQEKSMIIGYIAVGYWK